MSKPDFNSLGITAELTLHERALRNAQNEITALKAENARLREELRRATPRIPDSQDAVHNFGTAMDAILRYQIKNDPPFPPHHSTVGLGIDGEGRVQG